MSHLMTQSLRNILLATVAGVSLVACGGGSTTSPGSAASVVINPATGGGGGTPAADIDSTIIVDDYDIGTTFAASLKRKF